MEPAQTTLPIAWTIAGSDPGGGAGIQADLKVMNAFGVHGCSVITALTAQNTEGVTAVESVSEALLRAQLEALETDLPPAALKTGMLGSVRNCAILADFLDGSLRSNTRRPTPLLVCDPVLQSTSGANLLDPAALDILVHGIFPHAAVLTPNLPEAGQLLGTPVQSAEMAAEQLLELGVRSVLLKGGHAEGHECRDYWTDGKQSFWLSSPRVQTRATHGTGCILSAAIASSIALGKTLPDAVIDAKTFLNQCLRSPARIGHGHGPMRIERFENHPQDRPTIR
jgi:hydroxymethylpyrimidine kinase/phosphomethylpyrimidine kinase